MEIPLTQREFGVFWGLSIKGLALSPRPNAKYTSSTPRHPQKLQALNLKASSFQILSLMPNVPTLRRLKSSE